MKKRAAALRSLGQARRLDLAGRDGMVGVQPVGTRARCYKVRRTGGYAVIGAMVRS